MKDVNRRGSQMISWVTGLRTAGEEAGLLTPHIPSLLNLGLALILDETKRDLHLEETLVNSILNVLHLWDIQVGKPRR